MLLSLGRHLLQTDKWETYAEMVSHLEAETTNFILLNEEPEHRADFHSALIYCGYAVKDQISVAGSEESTFGLGLSTEIVGVVPHLLWITSATILVGFECQVVGIDLDKRKRIFQVSFDTPFRSFLLLENLELLLILTEIGVIGIRPSGEELWRHEKDVVNEFVLQSNILTMTYMDHETTRIDLLSGTSV